MTSASLPSTTSRYGVEPLPLRVEHRPMRENPWLVQFLTADRNWMTLSAHRTIHLAYVMKERVEGIFHAEWTVAQVPDLPVSPIARFKRWIRSLYASGSLAL